MLVSYVIQFQAKSIAIKFRWHYDCIAMSSRYHSLREMATSEGVVRGGGEAPSDRPRTQCNEVVSVGLDEVVRRYLEHLVHTSSKSSREGLFEVMPTTSVVREIGCLERMISRRELVRDRGLGLTMIARPSESAVDL